MNFFSKLGNNIILPKDVLIQSNETNQVPGAINATIGIATLNKKPMVLDSMQEIIKKISLENLVPYSPTSGIKKLREIWKNKILNENNRLNANYLSLPIVTTGITQGIDIVAELFTEGKEAIYLPNLFWQNYAQIFNIKKDNTIYEYNIIKNNKFNLNEFKDNLYKIKEKKIITILNFPNNPTGYTPSKEELNSITDILNNFCKENANKQLIVLCDDAYFGLFFEDNYSNSTINEINPLVDNSNCLIVKLDGITKEFYSWGFRVGFISYYTSNIEFIPTLEEKTQGFLRSSTSSPANISQIIALETLKHPDTESQKNKNISLIKNRYNILKEVIIEKQLEKYCNVLPFNSGYFFTIEMPPHINAHDFRLNLLHNYKYGVYSIDKNYIRIAFSCLDIELIPNLIECIKNCLLSYKS